MVFVDSYGRLFFYSCSWFSVRRSAVLRCGSRGGNTTSAERSSAVRALLPVSPISVCPTPLFPDVPGRSNPSPLSFFILIVRLVLESLPATAHSPRIDSEGGSVPWNCSARFLSKKKKKELVCSLSVCVIDVPLVLQPIEIQLGCVCRFRFMERWSLGASVVALLLLLSAASHGRGSSVRFSYACWVAVVYKLASK